MTKITLTVEQDPQTQDFFLQLPGEFLLNQDWRAGDRLEYLEHDGAEFRVVNHSKDARDSQIKPMFLVETVVTHRIRYAIQAPSAEVAIDAVVNGNATEFDQNCRGTTVQVVQPMTMSQYLKDKPSYLTVAQFEALIQQVG